MARRADRGYKLYFRYVKIEDVKCGVCVECEAGGKRAVVKMKNSNTSGLIKHLRLHHPSIYLDKVGNGGGPEDRKPFLDPSANNENDCSCRTTLPEGISEVSESQPGCSYPNFEMDVKTSSSSSRKWKLGSKMDQPPRKFKNVDCSQRFGEFDQESPSSHGFPPPDEAPVFLNESYMDLVKTEQEDDVPERVVPEETEDEFLAAGRKYAFDLRDMSREQRIILERIVSEVIYHGKSGRLNEGSGFVLGNF